MPPPSATLQRCVLASRNGAAPADRGATAQATFSQTTVSAVTGDVSLAAIGPYQDFAVSICSAVVVLSERRPVVLSFVMLYYYCNASPKCCAFYPRFGAWLLVAFSVRIVVNYVDEDPQIAFILPWLSIICTMSFMGLVLNYGLFCIFCLKIEI